MKIILLFLPCILCCNLSRAQVQRFRIDTNKSTVLPANNAEVNNGLKTQPYDQVPDPKVFAVEHWTSSDQSFTWKIHVTQKANYKVFLLTEVRGLSPSFAANFQLSSPAGKIQVGQTNTSWNRIVFPGFITLDAGDYDLQLRLTDLPETEHPDIRVYSIELATAATLEKNQALAQRLRSKPEWLAEAKYGLFFHWNSKSMPRTGEQKSYADAVRNFDVKKFAATVHETGADFIVFTTSWAEFYFPAPLRSVDRILPGRTSSRDLIADLSKALAVWKIKLLLYYHFRGDKAGWWKRQQFSPSKTGTLFNNMHAIFSEIGQRYANKIAGMWIDDGMALYPYGAPFETFTQAIKQADKNMIVGYNSWIYPKFTDFQDFYCGESGINGKAAGVGNDHLPLGGAGYFISGPQQGLKATFCGQLEPGDWTHTQSNQDIPAPSVTADELIRVVKAAMQRKNLPIMNVSIYQDGNISGKTLDLLKQLNKAINH